MPLQIIVSLFVMLIVFRLKKKFKDNSLKTSEFIAWLVLWLMVLVVFWLPQTTSYLALLFGIGRGVDLAVYLATLVIFYLVFRLYLKIDKQQKEITKIIRHLALKDEDKNHDQS
ncbi:MAG: hypothetical protein A2927_00150 [Candidatus Komeilibacteria bacterium RIFCSPLOWO2_01_FULL_45_10]|uniref:DUF2304 domain-containing protein n=1 Tax=Candidatus Komeilibacteria bacterium RIFCSPLOWO2_01_FULL_45_10 TaxID=1798550 RepID=A0A1G2BKF1_9BACT|nr:MAG: hypothetical protein A2927_00150 [Candidatus Komeilibacteria bacterium RIFCSPLOWO2_01_FULL_45_10]